MAKHTVALTDQAYLKAKELAAKRGFPSVDAFLIDVVREEAELEEQEYAQLFTPGVMAAIERGIADADAGRVFSPEEVISHLQTWREEWRREVAS